jgi:L-asparaginase/beta-aspartyl-peptidase (threonine type)
VCLDNDGVLAAATSTGGISGQPPGRVGDTPLIGAGTWADERVAVSCTGDGEAFVRAGAARHLATLVECGVELESAAARVLAEVGRCQGTGGLIALSADGTIATPHTSETMLQAVWRAGSDPEVRIPEPAGR